MHWSSLVSLMRPFLLFGQHDLHLKPKLAFVPHPTLKTDTFLKLHTLCLVQLFNNRHRFSYVTTFLRFPQSFGEAWLQWLFSLFGTYNQPWIDAATYFTVFYSLKYNEHIFCVLETSFAKEDVFTFGTFRRKKMTLVFCGLFFALSTVISQSHSVYKITIGLIINF